MTPEGWTILALILLPVLAVNSVGRGSTSSQRRRREPQAVSFFTQRIKRMFASE
jgi:hypothetical protein